MPDPVNLHDGLQSTVAQLGTMRDKATTVEYVDVEVTEQELTTVYRTSWLARKIVDIPATDSFREWREWQGEGDEIENLEEEERRLGLKLKCLRAHTLARLFGECFIYFDLNEDASKPVSLDRLKLGAIRFVTVLTHRQLTAGELEQDPLSNNFGEPKWYDVVGVGASGTTRIHPDRVVVFSGNTRPDDSDYGVVGGRRGDSVLYSLLSSVKNFDSTTANIASLIFEAKIDVISVKGLMDHIAGNPYEERKLLDRYRLAAQAKGNNGMLLLDGDNETYEQKELTFGSLPDLMDRFAVNAAGAADIPVTRLFGRSPAGMNATGDADLRNYYDRIKSQQELELRPALEMLDECLIRSALGDRPEELYYEWTSLWQVTEPEKQELGKSTVEIVKGIKDMALLPDEVLADALINMLTQHGVIPGLEALYSEFIEGGGLMPAEEAAAAEDDYYESAVPAEEGSFSDGLILDAKKKRNKNSDGNSNFDESKIKRDGNGKFAKKPDADAGVAAAAKVSKESKKYPKEKVAELAKKKPSELTFYEKKMVAKYKKAEKEAAAAPKPAAAEAPKDTIPAVEVMGQAKVASTAAVPTPPKGTDPDLLHFGYMSDKAAKQSLEEGYGISPKHYDDPNADFSKMSPMELMAGAEYAYAKGDMPLLSKIYYSQPGEGPNAVFSTIPLSVSSTKLVPKLEAVKPAAPKPMTPKEAFIAKAESDAGVLAQVKAAKVAEAQAKVDALKNSQGTAAYSNAKAELAAAKGEAPAAQPAQKSKADLLVAAKTYKTEYNKLEKEGLAGTPEGKAMLKKESDAVKAWENAPDDGPTPAAASGPSAKDKALATVATKQYPASKVEALLSKNPKELSFYEKKKLAAYKKALQAQKDDLSAAPKVANTSAPVTGAAAAEKPYYTDPFSVESQAAFAAIGKQHMGMKADTLTKFATGEWKPDGNKPYQQEAFDKVKNYLATGKITPSQGASSTSWGTTSTTPFMGSPSGSVYKGLQTTPPPITPKDKPQSTFAGHDELTGSEVQAVKSYTGSGYQSINGALRGKTTAGDATQAKIVRIDSAIAKSAAKTDMVVVRGISNNALAQMQKTTGVSALAPGGVIKDLGYISTTRSVDVASNFSSGVGLKIEVPKGSKILPVKNISNHSSEDEFILPRGSSFEILNLDTVNNVLHVRLLAA